MICLMTSNPNPGRTVVARKQNAQNTIVLFIRIKKKKYNAAHVRARIVQRMYYNLVRSFVG